ncbi:MAG: restriction endonuclease [Candidatus Contendobacter sp.]|nr:restriction endonuclease [Candidatus Contendobacter sp.]
MPDPEWQEFERRVRDLFRLKGFEAQPNQIVAGRQHDIILRSSDESIQSILVECKWHDPKSGNPVPTDDVNDFVATVLRMRASGDVSIGYLVTNTTFTATARGALAGRPEEKFVLLRTYAELRRGLVNFEPYLIRCRDGYETRGYDHLYEPLLARSRATRRVQDVTDVLLDFTADERATLLVLTGDYGTGKTTACHHFQYVLARKILNGADLRVPIFIPLKWYGQCGGGIGLLQRFLQEEGLTHASTDSLIAMHGAGQLVIIFDGFDEMLRRSTKDSRRESIQDLIDLCTPATKIILTGRPGYFSDEREFRSPFRGVGISGARDRIRRVMGGITEPNASSWHHFELQPLTVSQIRSLLARKSPRKSPEARQKQANVIFKTVQSTYNLMDLAARPILLEMIAGTLARRRVSPIANPATLYSLYVDTWLRVDADKGAFRSLVSPEDRLAFSITLAWIFQDNNIQSIHWTKLQELVGDYFDLEEADDVDHFGADIRACTFLVRDDNGNFSFAHLSFQEYFCARFLVDEDERLANLLSYTLEDPEVTLGDVANSSPAIINFAGDLLGCPVNPSFWERVNEILAAHPETAHLHAQSASTDETLSNMLAMSDGDISLFELRETCDAFRDAYQALKQAISLVAEGPPPQEWARELLTQLQRGRF